MQAEVKQAQGNWMAWPGAIGNPLKGTVGNSVRCLNPKSHFLDTAALELRGLHPSDHGRTEVDFKEF